jgi:hypothetical protein
MKIVGNKMYEICANCGKIVCLNKFLFGSLHVCSEIEGTPEEINYYRKVIIPEKTKQFNKTI